MPSLESRSSNLYKRLTESTPSCVVAPPQLRIAPCACHQHQGELEPVHRPVTYRMIGSRKDNTRWSFFSVVL